MDEGIDDTFVWVVGATRLHGRGRGTQDYRRGAGAAGQEGIRRPFGEHDSPILLFGITMQGAHELSLGGKRHLAHARTVISFWSSVPVSSEAMTLAEPGVSTAARGVPRAGRYLKAWFGRLAAVSACTATDTLAHRSAVD